MLSIGLQLSLRGLRVANVAFTVQDMAEILMGNKELILEDAAWLMVERIGFAAAGRLLKFSKQFLSRCGRNSFIQGTLVHTEQKLRPIEQIRIGDKVWSYDEATGEASYQAVTHLIQGENEYQLIRVELEDGSRIEATEGHAFYVGEEWKEAKDLTVDEGIRAIDGRSIAITGISRETRALAVFNLSIDGGHTYFVGDQGIMVHNWNKDICDLFDPKHLPEHLLRLAERNITRSNIAVLGQHAGYIDKARSSGASYFYIGKDAWDKAGDAKGRAANVHSLDIIAGKKNRVLLSIPTGKIPSGSGTAGEVDYLIKNKDYRWLDDWTLVPGD